MIEGQTHIDYSTDYPPAPDFPSAACQYTDPEIFFPISPKEYEEGTRLREVDLPYRSKLPSGKAIKPLEAAKDICRGCVHMIPCRDFAVINAVPFGVWGATSPRERTMLRRLVYSEVVVEMHVLEVEITYEESSYGEETG
jgi:hypothetical protein